MDGLAKMLDVGSFVLIWWQTYQKQETLKQNCENLFIWTELPILFVCLIIGSDNIFNIEVNVIVHNSLMQNWNNLKFWISDSFLNIYLLMA